MGLGRGYWFFAFPTSDSPGGRGEGGGNPKRRPESMGSGRLTLTSGNLAVHKSLKPHPPLPSFLSWESVDMSSRTPAQKS